jgi:putative transcriptional regulator
LTSGYISQLERGLKQPKGAALALLNIIRHKGFDTIRL